ncbi:MAG TPA: PAS domain-containing protein [Stellaceae bacterium]|nr:PAS domain-containing protein [Stellaceae bacterium]
MQRYECAPGLDDALPPCDAKVARLHAYWRSIRPAGARMPGRQHFDPAALPRLLPTMRLYDVFRDPWRFRYRLVGTELVRIVGRDMTGDWFDPGEPGSRARHSFENLVFVASGGGLSYHRGYSVFSAADRDYMTSERIMLPLARDGATVDMILALTVHHAVSDKSALQHTA